MDFLIKFAHLYEEFRRPEIEALAVVERVDLTVLKYDPDSPYCTVRLPDVDSARRLVRRSILAQSIHHLWGQGASLTDLYASVHEMALPHTAEFSQSSFKFDVDPFRGTRSTEARLFIIRTLIAHLDVLKGSIAMKDPEQLFTVFEYWQAESVPLGIESPEWVYLGRFVGPSSRDLIHTYDLKKRDYIARTSMDAELALITANMALAAPGKLFYDPFAGTGSFPVACAHFGALAFGSDIDGRSMRGEGGRRSLKGNFKQYGLEGCLGDAFVADLTHSPLRRARFLDGIVCDPPYGVREGLMVLGWRDPARSEEMIERSRRNFKKPDYVPPKKPYSFLAMLDDILVYATDMLVDNGRLSFWMPTANDEEQEIPIPTHPSLELVALSVQAFHKWSRRLITYRRLPDREVALEAMEAYTSRRMTIVQGRTVDDLNPFRANYFNGFRTDKGPPETQEKTPSGKK